MKTLSHRAFIHHEGHSFFLRTLEHGAYSLTVEGVCHEWPTVAQVSKAAGLLLEVEAAKPNEVIYRIRRGALK